MASEQICNINCTEPKRCKAVVETLVESLKDDPVNKYFSGTRSVDFVQDEVDGYLKAMPAQHHFISALNDKAVALWQLLPEENPQNEFWAGWQRFFKVPLRLWPSLMGLELYYEKQHSRALQAYGPYYYLSYIGTRPECRGKGVGSLLLKHICDLADAEGRYCVLEATSERSKTLYERHGFVLVEPFRPHPSAPCIYFMVRPPAPPAIVPVSATCCESVIVTSPARLQPVA